MNIVKKSGNFFNLLNGKDFLLLDTETTGIDENTNSLIQYASLKVNLEKKLQVEEINNEIILTLNNKYIKNLKFKEKISNNQYILENEEILIIENDIPIIDNGKKYKMVFPFIGNFNIKEEFIKGFNYKLSDTMNPHAMFIHKMYSKERLGKELNINNIKNFVKVIKDKELEKLEKILKQEKDNYKYIKDTDIEEKINVLENNINNIKNFKIPTKKKLTEKEYKKLLKDFFFLIKMLGYKEIDTNIVFNEDIETQEKIEKDLNENIISGHNVFNFDIQKFLLTNSKIKLENYNIIDTMYFYMESFKVKKNPSLDKLVSKGITNKLTFFKKEIFEPYIKYLKQEHKNKEDIIHLETLFKNGILKGIYTPTLFKEVKSLINKLGNQFNILEILEDLENILKLKEEREFLHDALLDIKLNLFAYDTLIEEYIEKYGLKDIDEKMIRKPEKVIKKVDMDIPYVGLNTEFTHETKTSNKEILKFCEDNNIKNISISDEIFTNYYKDYSLFKENNINNILSLKLKIIDLNNEHNGVNLIFQDKEAYENAKLLFDNYTITKEELYFLLDKFNIVGYIHPTADKDLEHKNLYVKVSPNIMFDYKNTKFKNKRSLWIGNRYTYNTPEEKVEHYIYTRFLKNEIINPIKIFDIYNNPDKYPNIGIPTKEELLSYFPYEEYKDIYENANNIINNSEVIDPEPKHIDLFPSIERILKLKHKLKTPEEYKELLLEKLKKEYEKKNFKISLKRLILKKWKENILNQILKERNSKNPNYKELNEIEQFINNIGPIDSLPLEIFELEWNKMPFWDKLKNKKLKEQLQKSLLKESETKFKIIKDRVNYELNALVKFDNYKIVFTYYFLISDILEVLDKQGMPHGPGRGSAAGSIISFILGVTKLEPTEYDLLFERFLNPERVSLPDVDIDLPYDDFLTKDKVIEILENHYKMSNEELKEIFSNEIYNKELVEKAIKKGHFKYTSKIITTSEITDKVAGKSMFRLLGMPFNRLNEAGKEWNDEESLLTNLQNNKIFNEEYSYMVKFLLEHNTLQHIEGKLSNFGRHAGGVRLPNSPIQAEEPATNDSTSTDKKNERNEAKMDLLGLVTVLALTNMEERLLNSNNKNKQLLIDDKMFVFDDPKVYKNIRNKLTASVFQVENQQLSELLNKLVVDDFETLIAAVALYRPGPLQTGDVDKYVIYRLNQLKENLKWIYKILKKEGKISNKYDSLTENEIKIFYNYYNSLYPGKYTYQNIFNILTVKEYYETNEFQQKIDNKLELIKNFIKDNPNYKNMSEEEILKEINKNLPEKEHKQELETIEKLYLKNPNNFNKKDVIEWEKEISNDPDYKEITSGTNGVIVYQEQIMKLSRVAGFTKGESDALRKVVAKSQKDKIKQFRGDILKGLQKDRLLKLEFEYNNKRYILQRNYDYDYELILPEGKTILIYNPEINLNKNNLEIKFNEKSLEDILKQTNTTELKDLKDLNFQNIKIVNKQIQKGMSKESTEYLFDSIVGFGSYAFNKSHAAAYATLTYKTALFKTYVPEIFYAEMLKLSSTKSIQELIREIHTKKLEDKNGNEFSIKLEMKNINNINSDFTINEKEHKIYLPPSIIKSVKEETISILELEMKKSKKKYSNIINILRRVPKFDKASFRQLGIAGLYKDMDTKNGLNEKFFYEYGDILFTTLKKWNEEQLFKDVKPKEKKEIQEYLKLRETILLNELYKEQLKTYNDRLENIVEQQGYDNEIDNISVKIEKIEAKIKELSKEDLEKYKLFYKKYYDKVNKKYLNENIQEIPNEIFEKIKEDLPLEKQEEFEKVVLNELNYTKEENAVLKHSIFKEFYFHEGKINLKTKNQQEISKLLVKEYMKADELEEFEKNYEVHIGKTPKIAVIFDKPNNNYIVENVKIKGKIIKVGDYNQVEYKDKKYKLDLKQKKLIGPPKDGIYTIDNKEIVIKNKSFYDKNDKKVIYTEVIIDDEKYRYDSWKNLFVNRDDNKKTISAANIEKEIIDVDKIMFKNIGKEIAKKLSKDVFEDRFNEEDFVIFHYKTRDNNKIDIEKILKEMNLSVSMITGTDLIKEVKNLSPIYSKLTENNTAYNIQTYPYGYTNILFFNNVLGKYNQLESKKLKSLEKKKIENDIENIKTELRTGTSNFILPDNLQGEIVTTLK